MLSLPSVDFDDDSSVILVGALQLLGPSGLIGQLRSAGNRVEPVLPARINLAASDKEHSYSHIHNI